MDWDSSRASVRWRGRTPSLGSGFLRSDHPCWTDRSRELAWTVSSRWSSRREILWGKPRIYFIESATLIDSITHFPPLTYLEKIVFDNISHNASTLEKCVSYKFILYIIMNLILFILYKLSVWRNDSSYCGNLASVCDGKGRMLDSYNVRNVISHVYSAHDCSGSFNNKCLFSCQLCSYLFQ